MAQLPDDPRIRDAEMNGLPGNDPIECPVCGQECEWIYTDLYGDPFGCDKCCMRWMADAWVAEQEEDPNDWDDGR